MGSRRTDAAGEAGPRRRPLGGGYARGEETRERIIEAAFRVFSEEGYQGASTRLIAARAGVNPPALQYYFDSKEGLHRACGQWILDRVMDDFGPVWSEARVALGGVEREVMVEALCGLMEQLAELMLPRTEAESWRRFFGRCQTQSSGPAFELIEQEFSAPTRALVTSLVARALGVEETDERARLRALLVLSQLSAFQAGADLTLEALSWPDFAGERAARVKETLRDHVARLLASPLPAPRAPASRARRQGRGRAPVDT